MTALTIIIADDHPLFRGALRQAVDGMEGKKTVIEAGDFEAARKAASQHPDADLLLLDLAMPGVSGFSGLMALRAEFANLPIVIVSASDDQTTIRRSLELGASGFISKSSGIDDIRTAIQTVLKGDIWTPAFYEGGQEDPDVADLIARLRTLTPQQ
ncbi:MAG: response regulator transcription factor, partial [Rhizobiaceae bacterium]|nr:response regulator transcription factor [Rhizobiaceae bacterium]